MDTLGVYPPCLHVPAAAEPAVCSDEGIPRCLGCGVLSNVPHAGGPAAISRRWNLSRSAGEALHLVRLLTISQTTSHCPPPGQHAERAARRANITLVLTGEPYYTLAMPKMLTVRVDDELAAEVKLLAKRLKLTEAEVIRNALQAGIAEGKLMAGVITSPLVKRLLGLLLHAERDPEQLELFERVVRAGALPDRTS